MNQIYCASEEAFASANRQSTAALDRQNMNSSTGGRGVNGSYSPDFNLGEAEKYNSLS